MMIFDPTVFSAIVCFCIGLFGVLARRNLLILVVSSELMINAVNQMLIAASRISGEIDPQILAILLMVVAAAGAAVALAIVIYVFRAARTVNVDALTKLQG